MPRFRRSVVVLCAALTALGAAPALGAVTPEPYRQNDFGGFRNILPPGANGTANAQQLGVFELDKKTRPRHNDDQLRMYSDLVFKAPRLSAAEIPNYFKDASFGVPQGQTESTTSPDPEVTIVRDKAFGVPHIYGSTRRGALFGEGYVAAQDRLFFIDVLRHAGRGQLSSFAGGAPGNRAMDEGVWRKAPYEENDLQVQIDRVSQLYGADGVQLQNDLTNYTAGVNAYIKQARMNPLMMPAEYAAIGQPAGPTDWKNTDVIAIAALVGGIFGKGGGAELPWGQFYQSLQKRFGARRGAAAFRDFRSPDDPEAPTTVARKRFPYRAIPRRSARGSIALPDRGSVQDDPVVTGSSGGASTSSARGARGIAGSSGLLALPHSESNALLVSARESRSGHPEIVFGPQVGYFSPQILMEQDVHAPSVGGVAGLDAYGASFPGTNLYAQLGRGRDYAWSATSAGQDIIDTFAVKLCQPGGSPTLSSNFYEFRGRCEPMERLTRTNSFTPNAADKTPPGSETLTTFRTKIGLVTHRGRIHGKPVAYTSLRSTYFHEFDSARGFADYNDPAKMRNPRAFQKAAAKIGFTFNWFYTDDKHIAYFNSGNNPVRARGTNPLFPVNARFEWRNFNPIPVNTASYTPSSQHPQTIDQSMLTSWNNKQAAGYNAPDTDQAFTPVFRSQLLDERLRPLIRGSRKASLVDVVNAMEDAGTADLRGDQVLPSALRILGRPRSSTLRHAVAVLRAWVRSGSHRRDLNRDGRYDQSEAVKIMDAWWPELVKADFGSALGSKLLAQLESVDPIDNAPHNKGDRLGSAWDVGFYGHVQKDLRRVLHARERGRYSRVYCGRGSFRRCRAALGASLLRATGAPATQVYPADKDCGAGDQPCYDRVRFRPLGGITQPLIPWINRPTFQQVVEIQGHGPR